MFHGKHAAIFKHIGGVPTEIWFDNTSTLVTKILKSGGRQLTDRFLRFSEHYGFRYRKTTRVAKLVNTAGFPIQHEFSAFRPDEVQFPSGVTVDSLKALEFHRAGNNLVMYGGTGTGKTMLSICIGMQACQKGIPVKFFRTAALINQLSEAQDEYSGLYFTDCLVTGNRSWHDIILLPVFCLYCLHM